MVSRRASRAAAAALALALGTSAHAQFNVAEIDFSTDDVDLTSAESLELELQVADPEALAARFANSTVAVRDRSADSLVIAVDRRARFTAAPDAGHLAASFVIDFDEPAVKKLRPEADGPATPAALSDLVFTAIPEKTQERGFDIASQAARSGEGDCTEHAVLTAAVARAQGLPARVVVGVVLLAMAEKNAAFGHAWSEVFVDEQWQIVDATQLQREATNVFYVPIGTIDNEGPGYAFSLVDTLRVMPMRLAARDAR
ncbi:MAG: transglutaminase-like domain-containing protein [Pseudomonadota bacterium]